MRSILFLLLAITLTSGQESYEFFKEYDTSDFVVKTFEVSEDDYFEKYFYFEAPEYSTGCAWYYKDFKIPFDTEFGHFRASSEDGRLSFVYPMKARYSGYYKYTCGYRNYYYYLYVKPSSYSDMYPFETTVSDASFNNNYLFNYVFEGYTFKNVTFSNFYGRNIRFVNAVFENVYFEWDSDADLPFTVEFVNTVFINTAFKNAKFADSIFQNCRFVGGYPVGFEYEPEYQTSHFTFYYPTMYNTFFYNVEWNDASFYGGRIFNTTFFENKFVRQSWYKVKFEGFTQKWISYDAFTYEMYPYYYTYENGEYKYLVYMPDTDGPFQDYDYSVRFVDSSMYFDKFFFTYFYSVEFRSSFFQGTAFRRSGFYFTSFFYSNFYFVRYYSNEVFYSMRFIGGEFSRSEMRNMEGKAMYFSDARFYDCTFYFKNLASLSFYRSTFSQFYLRGYDSSEITDFYMAETYATFFYFYDLFITNFYYYHTAFDQLYYTDSTFLYAKEYNEYHYSYRYSGQDFGKYGVCYYGFGRYGGYHGYRDDYYRPGYGAMERPDEGYYYYYWWQKFDFSCKKQEEYGYKHNGYGSYFYCAREYLKSDFMFISNGVYFRGDYNIRPEVMQYDYPTEYDYFRRYSYVQEKEREMTQYFGCFEYY